MASHPANTTIKKDWILSRLDDIIHCQDTSQAINRGIRTTEAGTSAVGGRLSHTFSIEALRSAIQSLREDITEGVTYAAAEVEPIRLASLFKITIPSRRDLILNEMKISHESDVPPELELNLDKLSRAKFDDSSTMSPRPAVDFLILECQLALIRIFPRFYDMSSNTPPVNCLTAHVFRDIDLSVQVIDPITHTPVTITGRADWACGYGSKGDTSTYILGLEANGPERFWAMENQLLTNMAILREQKIQAGGHDLCVFGFYTDGIQYVFMRVSTAGEVSKSRLYEVWRKWGLRSIYKFMLGIMEVDMVTC